MGKHTKKRNAFFITLFYPYIHKGVSYDAYVKGEVEQMARHFDSVTIISLSTGHNGQLPVPANVQVQNLNIGLTWLDKVSWVRWGMAGFVRTEIARLNTLYKMQLSVAILKAVGFYIAKAMKYHLYFKKMLDKIDFEENEVWIYCYWNFEYALAAALLKKEYPLKTVTRTHSLDLYFERMPEHYQPFKRYVYEQSDLFAFISEQGRNYFFEKHQIPGEWQQKSLLNYIGIENKFMLAPPGYTKIVLLSNAWIQPLKRIDLLIQSLALIDDIEIEWIHVGDDYGTNRFPEIKRMAAELLQNKKNIRYEFVGRKTIDELFDIYLNRKINLLINLSATEGTPVSMMEALSFGVPIIGTAVGGVPEIVKEGENGFLLPADISAQDVAGKLRHFHNLSGEQKLELSRKARKTWEEKFNAERNSAQLLEKMLAL